MGVDVTKQESVGADTSGISVASMLAEAIRRFVSGPGGDTRRKPCGSVKSSGLPLHGISGMLGREFPTRPARDFRLVRVQQDASNRPDSPRQREPRTICGVRVNLAAEGAVR